jgi:hypothetical protein
MDYRNTSLECGVSTPLSTFFDEEAETSKVRRRPFEKREDSFGSTCPQSGVKTPHSKRAVRKFILARMRPARYKRDPVNPD